MKGVWEKMYNEALERARKLKEMYPQDAPGYEEVFPELAESEDERIRKAIVEHFKQSEIEFPGLTFGGYYYADVLAWLEKQKEQEEIPLMNGDTDLYFDEWNQQNQNPTKRRCFEEGIRYAQRLQKEQKPVEIDEEINSWMGCKAFPEGTNITPLPQAMEIVERTAKHFFELGEKTVPSPGGYWEGFNAGVRECQAKIRLEAPEGMYK